MELSPEENAVRSRAISLVGKYWQELSPRVDAWLGGAFREDSSLRGEVALIMIRRFGGGHGHFVQYLRRVPHGSAEDEKAVLFYNARLISLDVARSSMAMRYKRRESYELTDISALREDGEGLSQAVLVDEESWPIDRPRPGSPSALDSELFTDAIRSLLIRGEAVWDRLCSDGVLDPSDWTEDQKWTAIGLMWGFSNSAITMIRRVCAKVPANPVSTRQMMTTVRRKGRLLLEKMSEDARRELDLPPLQDQGARRSSGS